MRGIPPPLTRGFLQEPGLPLLPRYAGRGGPAGMRLPSSALRACHSLKPSMAARSSTRSPSCTTTHTPSRNSTRLTGNAGTRSPGPTIPTRLGGQTREQVLTIMKDPRTGAFGVVGLVLLLGLKLVTLMETAAASGGANEEIEELGRMASRYGTIRFSFGHETTKEDIDYLFEHLPEILDHLRAEECEARNAA